MLTFEQFKSSIEAIWRQEKKEEDFCDALDVIGDGIFISTLSDDLHDQLLLLLTELMHDKAETIAWWLYEAAEDKRIWDKDDNVIANLDSVEALYDYLKGEK